MVSRLGLSFMQILRAEILEGGLGSQLERLSLIKVCSQILNYTLFIFSLFLVPKNKKFLHLFLLGNLCIQLHILRFSMSRSIFILSLTNGLDQLNFWNCILALSMILLLIFQFVGFLDSIGKFVEILRIIKVNFLSASQLKKIL